MLEHICKLADTARFPGDADAHLIVGAADPGELVCLELCAARAQQGIECGATADGPDNGAVLRPDIVEPVGKPQTPCIGFQPLAAAPRRRAALRLPRLALPSASAQTDGRAAKDPGAPSWDVLRPLRWRGGRNGSGRKWPPRHWRCAPAGGNAPTLGEALDRVACDAAGHEPLMIDVAALADAGLTPATVPAWPADAGKDAAPFWEALGLVYVPCRPAPLLTTRRRREGWQAAGGEAGAVPPVIEAAVAEAAANGHDTSGRFLWAVTWARCRAALPVSAADSSLADPPAPGWTEWEPVAGSEGDAARRRLRCAPVRAAGVALAAALLAAFWGLRRRGDPNPVGPAARLAGGGRRASCSGCPTPFTGSPGARCSPAVRSAWGGTSGPPRRRRSPRRRRLRASPHAAWRPPASWPCSPAAPPSWSGPPRRGRPARRSSSSPGRQTLRTGQVVLVPPDLLKQIDALTATGTPHGAAIVSATYEGKSADDHAEFEARLHVHNFEDGPVTLSLPFADVRLQDDGLLDGAARGHRRARGAGGTPAED